MNRTVRVECTNCGKAYHVFEHLIPTDIRDDEAFPMECAYCDKGSMQYWWQTAINQARRDK